MRAALVDRLFVVWIAAALSAWWAALGLLWALPFGSSGTSTLLTLGAMALSLGLSAGIPGWAARRLQWLLSVIRYRGRTFLDVAANTVPAARQGARAMIRLLSISAAAATIGGLVSTAGVYLSGGAVSALAGGFLWDGPAWAIAQVLIQTAVMLPMGIGTSMTFLVTALVRGGSGRDVYATVVREWLAGVAASLAILAAAWRAGAHLLGLALVAAVALLAAAGWLVQRVQLNVRPRRQVRPIEQNGPRGRLGRLGAVAAGYGGLTMAMVAQDRLLGDVMGIGLAGRVAWSAATVAMLTGFLHIIDRRSRPPSAAQGHGALLGALSGLVLQGSLAVRCLPSVCPAAGGRWDAAGLFCALLAAGAHVPLVALAAVVLSRQRRQFANAGGLVRRYLAAAAVGSGLAMLACHLAGQWTVLAAGGMVLAIAGMVAAALGAIGATSRPAGQLQWATVGAILICLVGASPVLAIRGLPVMRAGVWLTVGSPAPGGSIAPTPCLPIGAAWRSPQIEAVQAALLTDRPGRWWVVTPTGTLRRVPVPAAGAPKADPWAMGTLTHVEWGALDPAAATGRPPGNVARDFRRALATEHRLYDGVLLDLLPADHPDAWRCYNIETLEKCLGKVAPGGILAIRLRAAPSGLEALLRAAKTMVRAVQSGWAAAATGPEGVDALLVGAASASGDSGGALHGAAGCGAGHGVLIVPLGALIPPESRPRVIQAVVGPGIWPSGSAISLDRLRRHLESVQETVGR